MLGRKRIALAAAVLALVGLPACNTNLDKGSSADVVMEVDNVQIPPITASLDSTTGLCTVTVTNATASFKDKPKNSGAGTSPFNDIILKNVIVTYTWDDGTGVTGPTSFGVGGSIPAAGTSTASFGVITIGDLNSGAGTRFGHSASLVLLFQGETVSGQAVSVTTGGTLAVGSCS